MFRRDKEEEGNKVIKSELWEFGFAFKKDPGHWEARVGGFGWIKTSNNKCHCDETWGYAHQLQDNNAF